MCYEILWFVKVAVILPGQNLIPWIVCIYVRMSEDDCTFCTRCSLGLDTEPCSRGYYLSLILTLLKPSHGSQLICKYLSKSWGLFLSCIWESLSQTPFSAGTSCYQLNLRSTDSRTKTTVRVQGSKLSLSTAADFKVLQSLCAEKIMGISSPPQVPWRQGLIVVSWPTGLCPHFFTMSDSCSNDTLQPMQPACH